MCEESDVAILQLESRIARSVVECILGAKAREVGVL